MRTRHRALLIFFVSGWLSGITGLVLGDRVGRVAPLFAGVIFTLGVAAAIALSRALESVRWRFSIRRSALGLALFTVSCPIGLVVMALAIRAHDKLFPGTEGASGPPFFAWYLGSAVNALVIGAGLRTLTGRRETRLPFYMLSAPLGAALLSLILPGHLGEMFGVPVFFVTTNALLTLVSGVWLLRGASIEPEAA